MNRYSTVPRSGPSTSKATSTTTCQKCLKKGHYSYECKASVQSRPYISRPSRSQQLQNPKLKPALAELKMEDPKNILTDAKQDSGKPEKPLKEGHEETTDEVDREPDRKRRRSASLSSSSSVATISTAASAPRATGGDIERSEREREHRREQSKSSSSALSSPSGEDGHSDGDAKHLAGSRQGSRYPGGRRDAAEHPGRQARRGEVRHRREDTPQRSHTERPSRKNRRSRSPDVLPGSGSKRTVENKPYRQRSLSPYSRRLALTQAMNSSN